MIARKFRPKAAKRVQFPKGYQGEVVFKDDGKSRTLEKQTQGTIQISVLLSATYMLTESNIPATPFLPHSAVDSVDEFKAA